MEKALKFDYYYGIEAEQFSFYRVPRLLIKDIRFRDLSVGRQIEGDTNGELKFYVAEM